MFNYSAKQRAGNCNTHTHIEYLCVPSLGPWIALVTCLPCKGQGAEEALHGGYYVTAGGSAFLFVYSCMKHEKTDCEWV